ncbi:MAG: SGNH/GDSL hydrolase family protein [Saprospiraceae bacterium]|nr:SGNH/GDSL hydrolase family protein [Saprospiraceae bacterium]
MKRSHNAMKKWIQNGLTFALSCFFSLLLLEVALRLVFPSESYRVHYPNQRKEIQVNTEHLPGLDSLIFFSTNNVGLRGSNLQDGDVYRILALGGSTTECGALDDDQAWPQLLQKRLNDSLSEGAAWIGNAGVSGLRSSHHVQQARILLDEIEGIDLVIVLMGINDMYQSLIEDGGGEKSKETLIRNAFKQHPRKVGESWYHRTESWIRLRDLKRALHPFLQGHHFGGVDRSWEQDWLSYTQSPKSAIVPGIASSLAQFTDNLSELVEIVLSHDCQLLLLTQPTAFSEFVSEDRVSLIRAVKMMPEPLEFEVLENLMEQFNQQIRDVEKSSAVQVLELDYLLPKDDQVFYDDCHFNINGALHVSEILFPVLLENVRSAEHME